MMEREIDRIFLIADLSGYTALTETHGGTGAAKVIARYLELAHQALAPGVRIHERVGDELLMVAEDEIGAAKTATRLCVLVGQEPRFPMVRAGLHGGTVLEQKRRYFGPALNLTARVAAHARAGQILCTERIAGAVVSMAELECRPLDPVRLRNVVDLVRLFELVARPGRQDSAIDPVCRMQVPPEGAAAQLPYAGITYFFCSIECARAFMSHPGSYVD